MFSILRNQEKKDFIFIQIFVVVEMMAYLCGDINIKLCKTMGEQSSECNRILLLQQSLISIRLMVKSKKNGANKMLFVLFYHQYNNFRPH